jgi:hypothetical protein
MGIAVAVAGHRTICRTTFPVKVSVSTYRLATLSVVPALIALTALQPAPAAAQRASVFGTVYDSLNARPLAGALIQLGTSDLHGRVLNARTDSEGRFHLEMVQPGEYIVAFTHPFLDSLGLEVPPRRLVIDEQTAQIQFALAIPTPLAVRAQICPATTPADSSGLMLGFLRDADTDVHLDSGTVLLEWTEVIVSGDGIRAERKSASASATSAGWYAICGLSTAGPISARAEVGGNASGYIDIRVPPRGMLHRDFSIPIGDAAITVATADTEDVADSTVVTPAPVRRGNSSVSGVVRNENGEPLGGAQLMVWGNGNTATARDDGRFVISGLPAGTQTVEARYVGFAPTRVTVDLVSGRTVSTTITMSEHADVLDEVTVYGAARQLANDLAGFNQRRKLGFGRFITRADIEKKNPIRFTDLLRETPGLRIVATGGLDYAIVASHGGIAGGACQPLVFINGTVLVNSEGIDMMVEPQEIAAVEIYNGVGETPPQFRGGMRGECGSIAIWTAPNLPLLGSRP